MLPGRAAAAGEANENMPQEVDKLGRAEKRVVGGELSNEDKQQCH